MGKAPWDDDMELFDQDLLACVDDLNMIVDDLRARYGMIVVMDAFAEHVGTALQILRRNKLCTVEQTRSLIARMEESAFPDHGI